MNGGTIKGLPWNPDWLTQVWMRIGAVVWQAQCTEDALAKFITLVFQLNGGDARELAIDVLKENKRLTLGALLKKLRDNASLPEELEDDLRRFKDDRNWVIHHSYADAVQNLHNPLVLRDIITRVEQTDLLGYSLACLLWDVLWKLSCEFSAGGPVPTDTAQQIRNQWSNSRPGPPLYKRGRKA